MPEEVGRYAESVVVGEAEQTFGQVIRDFREGRMRRVYRSKGRADIDAIVPRRDIVDGKRYLKLGLIEAARGCRFRCNFCAVTAYYNATQTSRPIDRIVTEIEEMRGSKDLFFFVDDNMVSRPEQAKALYRELIPLGIRWVSQASITLTHDEELMALMRASGCQGVLVGFESLDPENLASINKHFNIYRGGFKRALERLNAHGLRLYATFMLGHDRDTLDSFKRTVEFCVRNKIFMAAFNHITPFPGTPLYEQMRREDRLLYDAWWLDDRYRYGQVPYRTVLPPEVVQEECVKARKAFYGLPSIAQRMFDSTNAGNLFINLLLRKEARQRENYPLGDLAFEGPPIPVNEPAQRQQCLPSLVQPA